MAKISVIMGVYREKDEYIRFAIESILNQTYSDYEFIIVLDDPYNTAALKILNEYNEKEERIIVIINKENVGLALSLNRAIEIAQGEYLARMDADDISLPDRFKMQIDFLDAHPNISVLGTNKNIMNENGDIISKGGHLPTTPENTEKVLKYANIIVHPSVMMRTKDIKKIGGYRNFPSTQDFDLWLRVLTSGLKICNLDEYLINYRINSQGVSMSQAYRQMLIGSYIRQLETERKKSNKDSFSKENLLKYLATQKADDPEEARKYQKARVSFEDGRIRLKNKRVFTGIIKLIQATLMHPLMRRQVKRTFLSAVAKHGMR